MQPISLSINSTEYGSKCGWPTFSSDFVSEVILVELFLVYCGLDLAVTFVLVLGVCDHVDSDVTA